MALTIKDIRDKLDGDEMDLSLMSISKVPVKEIASITKTRKLDLSCNQIVTLPDNFCPFLNFIVKLDLSKNLLIELPIDIFKLGSLKHLDLYHNELKCLPLNFCRLKTLRWLDLKDNPLNDDLLKVVGGCLDDQQCKKCAVSVVGYYQTIASNLERERQASLKLEREKEVLAKKEEELEAKKKKEQKKMEKEARKIKWEQMQQEKELESKKRKRPQDDSSGSESSSEGEETSAAKQTTWFLSFWGVLFTAFVAILACVVGIYFYCQENPSNEECLIVNDWTKNCLYVTSGHVHGGVQIIKDVAHQTNIKISEFLGRIGY